MRGRARDGGWLRRCVTRARAPGLLDGAACAAAWHTRAPWTRRRTQPAAVHTTTIADTRARIAPSHTPSKESNAWRFRPSVV
jgi:hypothetical protein